MVIMLSFEQQYLSLLSELNSICTARQSRAGQVVSKFGHFLKFPIYPYFPLLTTKKIFFRGIIEEILWMLRGDTAIHALSDREVNIWNAWAESDGTIGYGYGHQMRGFNGERSWDASHTRTYPVRSVHGNFDDGIDQIANIINLLKTDRASRRILLINYNPAQVRFTSLPPCHVLAQWYVEEHPEGAFLDCMFYMRSSDVFLGLPFNVGGYAIMTYIFAKICGLIPRNLCVSLGDVHLYDIHREAVEEQLKRQPVSTKPTVKVKCVKNFWEYNFEDFELKNYESHTSIKVSVAV